ncbi:MAG: 2-amino-4-hydroxy-6-hydroxymethyldihydropteridine diphosphokinase [Bacteroidetes bacterium]|nr:2-amino-4-hydroxy-6-hydroxymethyldihydropteridine diphosphokinase [Bacteroidota bacterium]
MLHQAVILLGSNEGDSLQYLNYAESEIEKSTGSITMTSSIYRTEAWGKKDQSDFFNKIIIINTDQNPISLLQSLLAIEESAGRVRVEKWGPRILDIDILYFDDIVYKDDQLLIPHSGISNRRFTLIPLCEVIPDHIHPVTGKSNRWMLDHCLDTGQVHLYNPLQYE